jgi:hypothetical protein
LVNIGDWKIAEMMIGYLPSFKKKKNGIEDAPSKEKKNSCRGLSFWILS